MLQFELKSLKGKRNFDEFFVSAIKFYEKDAALFVSYKNTTFLENSESVSLDNRKVEIKYSCVVRKKNAKKAVVRNRIKRLLRESIRRIFLNYSINEFETGISTLFIIWSSAPVHPKLIKLSNVYPIVLKLLKKAEVHYQSERESK